MSTPKSRPPIEALEDRRLFAAIALQKDVLKVTATPGVSNTITVALSADLTQAVATVAWDTGKGATVKAHALTQSFPLTDAIKYVSITGSDKADTITVSDSPATATEPATPFPIPTQIHAGGGNDTVTCGSEPDAVWGEGGNDIINGGGGNDSLYGMAGSDTLIGGDGADYLSGGTGKDMLEGDAGNDTLYDPYGPDTVLGGAGNNLFKVHSLSRDVDNDYNGQTDTLKTVPVPSSSSGGGSSLTDILGSILPFL
jgi:Ca2+-binding RTX toxin-like protein